MEMKDVTFWCDNMNVLWWIRNQSRKLKPFVANRVGLIHSQTDSNQRRYIPTKMNTADLLTTGSTVYGLAKNTAWWNGPSFLNTEKETWPPNVFNAPDDAKSELKKAAILDRVLFSNQTISEEANPNRFSNWNKLVRVNGWVSRFLNNSRSTKDQRKRGSLDVDELQESEKGIIIKSQKQSFFEEYRKLVKGNALPNSSKILALKPQLDEDRLLRSCGRPQNVNYLSYDVRHPIILPRGHIVTKLIIK